MNQHWEDEIIFWKNENKKGICFFWLNGGCRYTERDCAHVHRIVYGWWKQKECRAVKCSWDVCPYIHKPKNAPFHDIIQKSKTVLKSLFNNTPDTPPPEYKEEPSAFPPLPPKPCPPPDLTAPPVPPPPVVPKKKYYQCKCGSKVIYINRNRHFKSQKHKIYILKKSNLPTPQFWESTK